MTTFAKIKAIADELLCITHDLQEIKAQLTGNEKLREEIACVIDDVQEIVKICQNNGTDHDGSGK